MSRWLHSFQAINPKTPPERWEVGVPEGLFRKLRQHGHTRKISRLILVDEVLSKGTIRIHGGWCRPDKDDCFVYEGRPERDYRGIEIETPAPPNMAFLVFVLPCGTIDDWTWRLLTDDNKLPKDMSGKIIWEPKAI